MNIREIYDQVEGWLLDNEGELLYSLARKCLGNGVIVEIGSWKGRSTICLALGSQAGKRSKVYAIDPHTGNSEHHQRYGKVWTYDEFINNIRKMQVDDLVVPLVKTSEAAVCDVDEPVELLFVDGAHEYELVKQDFELWSPKVIPGGIIAIHDYCYYPGPKAIADVYLYQSDQFKVLGMVDSIVYAAKL